MWAVEQREETLAAAPVAAPAAAPPAAGSSETLISVNEDLREVFAQASGVCARTACVSVSVWTRRLEGGRWAVESRGHARVKPP